MIVLIRSDDGDGLRRIHTGDRGRGGLRRSACGGPAGASSQNGRRHQSHTCTYPYIHESISEFKAMKARRSIAPPNRSIPLSAARWLTLGGKISANAVSALISADRVGYVHGRFTIHARKREPARPALRHMPLQRRNALSHFFPATRSAFVTAWPSSANT